jgi:hypothetical protein
MKKKVNPDILDMVNTLAGKLTKEEFFDLYVLIDGDPPGGPFFGAMGDKAVELCPEEFFPNAKKKV